MADFFEMMMSGSGLDGYKPRSALDLLISVLQALKVNRNDIVFLHKAKYL